MRPSSNADPACPPVRPKLANIAAPPMLKGPAGVGRWQVGDLVGRLTPAVDCVRRNAHSSIKSGAELQEINCKSGTDSSQSALLAPGGWHSRPSHFFRLAFRAFSAPCVMPSCVLSKSPPENERPVNQLAAPRASLRLRIAVRSPLSRSDVPDCLPLSRPIRKGL